MGIDFIERIKASFQRRRSEQLRRLEEQNLFDGDSPVRRAFSATMEVDSHRISPGMKCLVYETDEGIAIFDNNNVRIGSTSRPPHDVQQILQNDAYGVAIVTVERVSDLIDQFEVVLDNES